MSKVVIIKLSKVYFNERVFKKDKISFAYQDSTRFSKFEIIVKFDLFIKLQVWS